MAHERTVYTDENEEPNSIVEVVGWQFRFGMWIIRKSDDHIRCNR